MKKTSLSDLEKEKRKIITWVKSLKDDTSIERLRLLREKKQSDWWDQIGEEEKAAIDKGIADIKAGKIKPHRVARKIYEKWL